MNDTPTLTNMELAAVTALDERLLYQQRSAWQERDRKKRTHDDSLLGPYLAGFQDGGLDIELEGLVPLRHYMGW